jgi:hypothetical protein
METAAGRRTERLVLAIGEISVTRSTVLTPAGTGPVNGVAWAIREDPTSRGAGWWRALSGAGAPGTVNLGVTVSGEGWEHTEWVPGAAREDVAATRAKVTQARMLALRSVVWSLGGAQQGVTAPPTADRAQVTGSQSVRKAAQVARAQAAVKVVEPAR